MGDNEIEIIVDVDDRASDKFDNIHKNASKLGSAAASAVEGFASAMMNAGQNAADFATKTASAGASAGVMAAGSTAATGGMNLLAGAVLAAAAAIPALIAGFLALAPVLSLVGGLAGAAVTGLIGAGIAAATLGVGLGGVGDAWGAYGKQAGGGGGASKAAGEAAYQAARRVEQAEEALTRAKRSAKEASEAVNRAREDERERIEDLTLALRGQQYAQDDASKSLDEAKEKLKREQTYGNSHSVAAAQAEVDRAQYRYDYETERLKDLQKEKADADRKGIEGSEQVKSALQREKDAADAVTDAMESLADAKRKVDTASGGAAGGINAFDEAMAKLSPNARKFVLTLIDLKEKFESVKRAVQDRLFAGLDETLRNLAEKWGPHLVPILGGMADAFNRMAKDIAEGLGDSEFIANIEKIGDSFEVFIGYLGDAVVDLLDGLARLGAAAGPVFEKVGEIIADIAESFADWMESAEKSGALESFMEDAVYYLGEIYDIGKLAFSIMGDFIKILFPSSESGSKSVLAGIKESLEDVSEWLGDPKNQQQIRDMFDKFGDFFDKLVTEWIPDMIDFGKTVGAIARPIATVIRGFQTVHHWLTVRLPQAIGSMARRGGNIFNGVREGFKAAINWIIDKWNSLNFTLPSVSVFGQTIGGGSIGTPHIDRLATGGITGNGQTIMNERGPEAVRLPSGSMVYSAGDSARMMGAGSGRVETLRVKVDRSTERGVVNALLDMLRFEIENGYGGDVQRALGKG